MVAAHIAGASAKNIISIHGPTNFYQSAPYSTKYNDVKVATLNLKCSPCYDTEAIKNCKKNICMQDLNAETVMGSNGRSLVFRSNFTLNTFQ